MLQTCLISLRMLLILSFLTGILYPLGVTILGTCIWPSEASGSLVYTPSGTLVGSALLAQKFTQAKYFHPRPSAADYATLPSGASNQSATNQAFANRIRKQLTIAGIKAPIDMLTTSASGLDPHLSLESALYQLPRVVEARNLSRRQEQALQAEIHAQTIFPRLGFIGKKMLNVLALNQALDRIFP